MPKEEQGAIFPRESAYPPGDNAEVTREGQPESIRILDLCPLVLILRLIALFSQRDYDVNYPLAF